MQKETLSGKDQIYCFNHYQATEAGFELNWGENTWQVISSSLPKSKIIIHTDKISILKELKVTNSTTSLLL